MKKIILLLLGLIFSSSIFSQETVIWGSDVVDLSSEFGPYEYAGIQVLHKPNVLPGGGDNPNSWRPKKSDTEDFIMVSFETPIIAKQVAIAESENPGAVIKIIAYDQDYNEYNLFPELTPRSLPIESRLLNLFFEQTQYKIQAIKIVIDGASVPGYNAIDAIGISESNIPINVLIKLAKNMNEGMDTDRLGKNVNSSYQEHSPVLSPDGKKLYFSRQYHPDNVGGESDQEDIWVSELDDETGEWLPAKNVGPPLNTDGPNFISSISSVGGQEIVVLGNTYGKKGRMYTGVSTSVKNGESFEAPQNVEIEDFYNYSQNADFFMVPGAKSMLISAERDDSYGLRDLYVTFKKGEGWSSPLNLGDEINTVGDEESPFLAEDAKTLYFSTNGQSGYGGKDIYVSRRLDDSWTKWSTPENLGAGINKEGDDEYFSIPASGEYAYFTRGDKGEDMDIFTFKVEDLFVEKSGPVYESMKHLITEPNYVTIEGLVVNSQTGEIISGAKVEIESLPDGVKIGETVSGPDGAYTLKVALPGARYGVIPSANNYLSESENFDFSEIIESTAVKRDLKLVPEASEIPITFNNIFFDFDKATLQTASFPELGRVHKLLEDGALNGILITGHTDSVGPEDYNLSLSKKRASAVYNYFLEKGIAKDRLKHEGFGESKPSLPNDSKENRAKNRRVEFTRFE